MTFSTGSFLKKLPDKVITVSAAIAELIKTIPINKVTRFFVGIGSSTAFDGYKSTSTKINKLCV
jgi:hypothetical protein